MKISQDVLNILSHSSVDGHTLFLPPTQLERNLYLAVNKCLELIGGHWDRKAKGHVFSVDPSDLLDEMINTGEVTDSKKEFQFFETPRSIVQRMIGYAEIKPTDILLEPSAGNGAILKKFPKENTSYAIELNDNCYRFLKTEFAGDDVYSKPDVYLGDFLMSAHLNSNFFPSEFDKIIMNPPFSKGQDIRHIFHAHDILKKGGRLVSIVSESPFFRENKLSQEFREWLFDLEDKNLAMVYDLDAGTFKESGTMVKARIIVVDKS